MKKILTDVDIDCINRDGILAGLEYVSARIDREGDKFDKHPTGVYFQNIPRDPVSNISTLDAKFANNYGYFKIDFLNVNFYEGITSEEHLLKLINTEPEWEFLQFSTISDQLFHLNGYSELLTKFKPQSIEDLAMILAIIRPAKAHLRNSTWEEIRAEVWKKNLADDEKYSFKRSHGIAYAIAIVVNLNLLLEEMTEGKEDILSDYMQAKLSINFRG